MAGRARDHPSDATPTTTSSEVRHRHRRSDKKSSSSSKHKNLSGASKGSKSSRQSTYSSDLNSESSKERELNNTHATAKTTSTAEDEFHIIATETARERMRKISNITGTLHTAAVEPGEEYGPGFQIVATDTARERMRKISTITDPCEPEYGVVVTTGTAHDRMRKMSRLGLEDPVDNIAAANEKDNKNSNKPKTSKIAALRESEQQRLRNAAAILSNNTSPAAVAASSSRVAKASSPRGRSSSQNEGGGGKHTASSSSTNKSPSHLKSSSHNSTNIKSSNHSSKATPSRDRTSRRTKSDGAKQNLKRSKDRNHSDGNLSEFDEQPQDEQQPKQQQHKSSRVRSLDNMDEMFNSINKEDLVKKKPYPTTAVTGDAPPPSIAIGQMISATEDQKQLMRKVSALGLEDPIFGNVHPKEMNVDHHASMIFDDMNLEDIPTDMRDMLSVASDHTATMRIVDRGNVGEFMNDGQGVVVGAKSGGGSSSAKKEMKSSTSTPVIKDKPSDKKASASGSIPQGKESPKNVPIMAYDANYVPPMGSFARRESKRMSSKDLLDPKLMGKDSSNKSLQHQQQVAEPPVGSFLRRESKRLATKDPSNSNLMLSPKVQSKRPVMMRSSGAANTSSDKSLENFAPPTGSFRIRSPRKTKNHLSVVGRETLMENICRTRREEAEDPVRAAFGQSMPDLGFNDSFNNESVNPKSIRSNQSNKSRKNHHQHNMKRKTSLRVVPHEEYVPPPAPPELTCNTSGGEHRALPASMEYCFTPSPHIRDKKWIQEEDPLRTDQQQQRKPPHHHLKKTESSRSWDGDLGIDDSPPTGRPPMSSISPAQGHRHHH